MTNQLEWRFVDKSGWPEGPWNSEPDKIQWQDKATGLTCLIRRSLTSGSLCGYVGVPKEHPWFGLSYANEAIDVDVHGGLTFSQVCDEDEEHGICHVPAQRERAIDIGAGEETLFWFGFDTAHADDYMPKMVYHCRKFTPGNDFFDEGNYKDVAYVRAECASLAKQLKEVEKWQPYDGVIGAFTNFPIQNSIVDCSCSKRTVQPLELRRHLTSAALASACFTSSWEES